MTHSTALQPAHILLADDDAELRATLGAALRLDGHRVTEVPDGWELSRHLAGHGGDPVPVDVVVTDVRMPGPSVFSTLDRPWACTADAPALVMMSAFADTVMHRRARELGAAMFDKPFDVDDLRTCVGQMVSRELRWRPRRDNDAPKRVLVAEDDAALRELVARELRKLGHVVDETDSGFALLGRLGDAELDGERFDLLVTDVRMPGVTGMSVLRGLRVSEAPHLAGLPTLVMTAFADNDVHVEARRLGAIVLDKPFEMDDLRMWTRLLLAAA